MRMEESRKGASSTTDLRKKNILLDGDVDDEFMKSWKSISVTEDDTVDFSFGTVSKSKNKAFDFGTLDVDFNLDGSFETLSSFKMDVPDLDFSCQPKKTTKAGSSCKEELANENNQKQIDSLNFSFDFKELDSFDVDKSLENGGRTCNQKQDTVAVSSSRVDCEGSKIDIAEENTAFDNSITKKYPASRNETSSKVETFQGDHGDLESEVADGTSHEARNVEHTTNKGEQFEKSCLSEKEASRSSNRATHDILAQFIGRNDAPEFTSELQPEICTLGVESNEVLGGGENVTNGMIDSDGTSCDNLPQRNLSPLSLPALESNQTEREKSECSHQNDVVDNIQQAEGDLDIKASSKSDALRKVLLDTQESRENQSLKLKLLMVPLCRGPLINKVTMKEKEMGGNSSMLRTDVIHKPQPHQSSSIGMKISSSGNNRIDALNQRPATGEGNLGRDSLPHDKVASTAPPVVVETEKTYGKLNALSVKINPSNSCLKTTTQTHNYSEFLEVSMVPSRSSKIISAQESKLRSIKTSSKFPNLSRLKTSRDFGGKQVLSTAGGEKERKSGDSEQNMEPGQRSGALDIGHCAENAEKCLVSNLKRKALEAPNAVSILSRPLKRLSLSPGGFRSSKEPSDKKIEEQVEGMTTNASHDHLASSTGNPHMPITIELETSSGLENDGNVEKAEAYAKKLEDICNMLRKKLDEAKEVLVRAIVNNNNLLMLNHPIYEEKIRKVQKFAAKLLSKELQTKAA